MMFMVGNNQGFFFVLFGKGFGDEGENNVKHENLLRNQHCIFCEPAERLGRRDSSTTRRSWWLFHPVWVYWSNLHHFTQISREKFKIFEIERRDLVELKDITSDMETLQLTIWIQHAWDVQVFLSNIKCCVQILHWIVLWQFWVVNQVRSMSVIKNNKIMTMRNERTKNVWRDVKGKWVVDWLKIFVNVNIHENAKIASQ